MNIFTIAGIIGISVIFLGVFIAAFFSWLSRTVIDNQEELAEQGSNINTSVTLGYEIPTKADVPEQLQVARRLSAARAATLPRGANMRIGRLGNENTRSALASVEEDPWTATKIAAFHTWQGAKSGPPVGGVPQEAAPAAQVQAAPTKKPEDLVPGVDYEWIEITDDMSPDEVRRARISNAKARSAAIKALKQQAAASPAPSAGEPGEPAAAAAQKVSPAAPAAATGVPEPDYVEITDEMSPDEVRKARIQNSRARSAYYKALKEAGVDPKAVEAQKEHPGAAPAATEESRKAATPASPTPATGREAVAVPDDIPEPDYIEITDDMAADEVRQARVHNAKARSQFYRELKARGIDPKELEAQQSAVADAAATASQAADEAVPAAEKEAAPSSAEIPANVTPPDYVEITEDMDADELRQARIQNARERSRFLKDVKAAGVDPRSLPKELTQP